LIPFSFVFFAFSFVFFAFSFVFFAFSFVFFAFSFVLDFLFFSFDFHYVYIILKCKLNFSLQNENKNKDYTVHMLTFEPDGRLYIEFHVFVYVHNLSLHKPHQFRARFHAVFSNPRRFSGPSVILMPAFDCMHFRQPDLIYFVLLKSFLSINSYNRGVFHDRSNQFI